jgi:hypothetical protein
MQCFAVVAARRRAAAGVCPVLEKAMIYAAAITVLLLSVAYHSSSHLQTLVPVHCFLDLQE